MLKKLFLLVILFFGIFLMPVASFAADDEGFNWAKGNLSVYIPKDNSYSGMMTRAFKKWQDNSYGHLTFTFIDKTPADIEVNFPKKTDGSDVGDLGSYSLLIKGGHIVKATIDMVPDSNKYSKDMIYTVMLHEVGHALGLIDTKRNLGIMHTPVNEKQDIIQYDIFKLFRLNDWSFIGKGNQSDLKNNSK